MRLLLDLRNRCLERRFYGCIVLSSIVLAAMMVLLVQLVEMMEQNGAALQSLLGTATQ